MAEKRWFVMLKGWEGILDDPVDPYTVAAPTRSKAKAQAYRDYCDGWHWIPFMEFLALIVSIRRVP